MIGSFLNVLIYRLPLEIDWIYLRSFCPKCNNKIPIWHNIPIFSFVFQRGKCNSCQERISWQYPVVELLTAFSFLVLFPKNINLDALYNYLFLVAVFSAFIVHFIVDIKHKILPDQVNIYLALLFVVYGFFKLPLMHVFLGGVIGFFIPYSVAYAFYKLKGIEGLGGGDIKLYGALGLYLGPQGIMTNIFLSCLLGSLVGVLLILTKVLDRNQPLAFGPFIVISAFSQIFFPSVVEKLINLIGFLI